MGTNYYFITRSSKLAHEYFCAGYDEYSTWGEEYELNDIPEVHYKIHLNKLSCGWKPLFQNHKAFKSFSELEQFYNDHKEDLEIYDEYGEKYTFDAYKQEIIDHANVPKRPMKWVIEDASTIFGGGKMLTVKDCSEEEAEIYSPFDHREYDKSKTEAALRLDYNGYMSWKDIDDYHADDEYNIDWVEGEFS